MINQNYPSGTVRKVLFAVRRAADVPKRRENEGWEDFIK